MRYHNNNLSNLPFPGEDPDSGNPLNSEASENEEQDLRQSSPEALDEDWEVVVSSEEPSEDSDSEYSAPRTSRSKRSVEMSRDITMGAKHSQSSDIGVRQYEVPKARMVPLKESSSPSGATQSNGVTPASMGPRSPDDVHSVTGAHQQSSAPHKRCSQQKRPLDNPQNGAPGKRPRTAHEEVSESKASLVIVLKLTCDRFQHVGNSDAPIKPLRTSTAGTQTHVSSTTKLPSPAPSAKTTASASLTPSVPDALEKREADDKRPSGLERQWVVLQNEKISKTDNLYKAAEASRQCAKSLLPQKRQSVTADSNTVQGVKASIALAEAELGRLKATLQEGEARLKQSKHDLSATEATITKADSDVSHLAAVGEGLKKEKQERRAMEQSKLDEMFGEGLLELGSLWRL